MSHTPGPWSVRSRFIGPLEILREVDGVAIGNPVALVGAETFPECAANAELIAAAPELLEVLQAYVAWEVEYMTINALGDPEKQHNVKWARSVIAKATMTAPQPERAEVPRDD
jgi:hypothetical protein